MTSSMMAGEKKWATARRSGMTVLGKVAVPKPLNLPSQKLENHGLNPNVDIVPKGTLGWGSQSSSVPNAWGSSPKADGSTASPSHLSGRLSSETGTRPSTAGNDRTQDPTSSVWGPTSRPSSASGALTSNQTAVTNLRPHSAETRSGSSQLSRFAEPPPDNSLTWGPNGSSNNLRGTPSNSDGFSLSSGDFPTLGSEKDGSGKNIDSQEYGNNSRPGSSSGKATSVKENITSLVGNAKGETVNTWTREDTQHNEHGVQPTAERWHGDFPHGGNPHRPLQHFDAWHGPPMNRPPAGWYGSGPPRGPPYGPPLQPGGFPMEPFPYYRPHIPPQQVPHGAAARGHHPQNGDLCRPHVPEGYIRPRMPMNPGFYPAPVGYEGFYGPPMGYCNPNERDMPFMGMPPGPHVYKRHPYENADPHPRSPAHGSRGKPATPERMAPRTGHSDDTRGPYKVLLKQSTDRDEKRAEGEWDRGVPSNIPFIKKKDHLREPLQKNEWGLEDDEGTYPLLSTKFPENRGSANAVVNNLGNKPGEESSFSQLPQVHSASPRGSTLMHDAKARNIDGRSDVAVHPFRENRYNQPHASGGPLRRNIHDAQSRVDYRGKRLNNQDDGLRNKTHAGEFCAEVSVTDLEASANVLVRHHPNILVESGNYEHNLQGKTEADYSTLPVDESDSSAQRAKMREIAKQRAEKLQREEEERTREQKAKALAKLEELNRRSHIADASNQKLENAGPSETAEQEEEKSPKYVELNTDSSRSETSSSAVICNRKVQIRNNNSIMVGENTVVFNAPLLEKPDNVFRKTELINSESAFQVSDGIVAKNKRTEYKQRQSANSAKAVIEKSFPLMETGTPYFKAANDGARPGNLAITVSSSGEPCLVANSIVMTDSSTHHKRKSNRSSKNKHKADVVTPVSVVPSTVAKEDDAAKVFTETREHDTNVPQSKTVAKLSTQVLEQHSSLTEETSGKGNHQGKPQQSRRMPRNQQANNRMGEIEKSHSSETVTWAPVRSQNKIELTDKPGDKADPGIDRTNVKVASVMQNNIKNKRAEMERYIPKPVANELAHQGNIQQLVVTQSIKGTQPGNSAIADAGRSAESKNGDIKQNNPSNARGSWKQRVYVESALNHGLQEAGKKPIEQNQPTNSDVISSKVQTTDGWNSNEISDTSASVTTGVTKGQGVPGRGKRHPFKGDRRTGNTFELDCETTDEASSESAPACEMNHIDNKNGIEENCFVGERTAQWKPKTQVYTVHNSRNRTSQGQMSNPATEARVDQYHSEPANVEARNVAHQDFDRARNPSSSRGRLRKPYGSPANDRVESEIVYGKNDQQFSSGVRKYGNHNNRSSRGHEPRGDASFNRERPRHTSHFEYQPVGQFGINKPNKLEDGVTEDSNDAGPIYRERNHAHPRRGGGNLYGRQSEGGHGDPSYY